MCEYVRCTLSQCRGLLNLYILNDTTVMVYCPDASSDGLRPDCSSLVVSGFVDGLSTSNTSQQFHLHWPSVMVCFTS